MSHSSIIAADENQFRILDHIPLGVVVINSDYHVIFWNKCLEYWTGLSSEQIKGRDIREPYPLLLERRFASRIATIFQGGPPIIFSSHIHKYLIPAKLPNNLYRLQHVTISPMRQADGAFLAMFMIQDVTEVNTRLNQRKKAEDELRRVLTELESANKKLEESNAKAMQMAREAREANAAKSIFLANMSHEIRTPMSGILGALDMLSSKEQDPEKLSLLGITKESAASLLQIINDILDLSKVEAGKLELHFEEVALEPTMRRCLQLFSFPARAKGLDLQLILGPNLPPTLRIDPTRLEQILRNLLDNAVKFTSRGQIVLGADLVDGQGLAEPIQGPVLRFWVKDSGIGISDEALSRLFQPFTQADSSYAKTYGGTGLGLVMCKRLVELMGGSISVQSTLGQGCTFTFAIPMQPLQEILPAPQKPEQNVPEIAAQPAPGESKAPKDIRVLVAEDVPLNQQYLAFILERNNYCFDLVSNGLEALRAFGRERYDIILMDIQMPEMDGLEATSRIRNLEREQGLHRTPIIALTAYAMPEEQEKFILGGMDAFSPKPIQEDHLLEQIRRHLAPSSGHPQPRPKDSPPDSVPEYPVQTAAVPAQPADGSRHSDQDGICPANTAPPPVFNTEAVQNRFMGNDQLWKKMVRLFVQEEFPGYRQELQHLARDIDIAATARLAHKLKGALGTLCAESVEKAARDLEIAAKRNDPRDVASGLRILLAEMNRLAEHSESILLEGNST